MLRTGHSENDRLLARLVQAGVAERVELMLRGANGDLVCPAPRFGA